MPRPRQHTHTRTQCAPNWSTELERHKPRNSSRPSRSSTPSSRKPHTRLLQTRSGRSQQHTPGTPSRPSRSNTSPARKASTQVQFDTDIAIVASGETKTPARMPISVLQVIGSMRTCLAIIAVSK
eukprot:2535645-Rhodomonas_salina.1